MNTTIMREFLKGFTAFAFVFSMAMVFFVFHAQTALAAAVSWDGGGGDGEWETATNWDGDAVPTDADDVTIDVSETININATTTINSLTLGNVNSPVLNFDYDALTSGALIIDDGNLTVGSNATITHTVASTSTVVGTVYIDVQTGNADVDGSIDVEQKGFRTYYGDGAGGSGSGGGYGGDGGGANGGSSYGSVSAPVDLGSGGGSGQSNYSYGGGAIRLNVAGTLDLDAAGVISADGSDNLSWYGPGASGGSVYLDVGTLSGSGTIRADGGSANNYNYGDGGGGRVAIYYDTDSSSITPTAYGAKTADSRAQFGGAGTVYMKDNAQTYGDVTIDNNSYHNSTNNQDYYIGKTPLGTATYRSITLSNNGHLALESGVTLTYTTLTWTGGEITDNGGILATVTSGDVVVPASAYLYANTARTGGSALTSLTVNGILTHSKNISAETYTMDLETTGDITVASGGAINVDSMGYTLGQGPGAGNSNAYGASTGGSYGGQAARYSTDHPATYGSITAPVNIGSGSGSTSGSGGSGGGAIKLTCGGTLTVTGDITADGGASNDAGGSGGSIYLDVDTLAGAGTIGANGGARYGGGGGRVAVYYDTDSSSITPTAYGGYYAANAERMGGAGTVYLKDNAQSYGDLGIDNNGNDYSESDYYQGKTPLDSATYRSITISNDGNIEIDVSDTITYTTLTWTGGNITDNGATFAALTGDVIVPTGSRLIENAARTVDSLTIYGNLEHSQNTTAQDYVLDYTVSGNVTIDASGSIDVSGLGYIFEQGPGAGIDASNVGSGAGHAGTGADSTTGAAGGSIYDTIDSPDTIGSGGGTRGDWKASDGGGAVKMMIAGDISIGGDIDASAGTDTSWNDWGGSSGGSIWIEADGACSGSGNLSANGSSAYNSSGGAGAGGYIRMMCGSTTWAGSTSVIAGTTGQTAEAGSSLVNIPPSVTTPVTTVATDGSGEVTVEVTIDDSNDDDVKLKVEYSTNSGSTWSDATLSEDPADTATSTGTPTVENDDTYQIGTTTGVDTSSGANTVSFVWDAATDEPTGDISGAQIRVTPADTYVDGSGDDSVDFSIDNVAPVSLAGLDGTVAGADVELTWTAATDTNFNHYEVWYGGTSSDVDGRTGTATEWDDSDDAALATATTATTTVTEPGDGTLYFKIWAIDDFGNETTIASETVTFPTNGSVRWEQPTSDLDELIVSQDDGETTDDLMSGKWSRISWDSAGTVPYIILSYSQDTGSTWTYLMGPIVNHDSVGFVMPHNLAAEVLFRAEATDLAVIVDSIETEAITILPADEGMEDEEVPEEEQPEVPQEIPQDSPFINYSQPTAPSPVTGEQEDVSDVEPGDYIKAPGFSTVYFVTENYERKPFFDAQTYFTWEDSFDEVETVTDATLTLLNLAGPMPPKPEAVLVKIQSDPRVFIVRTNPNDAYKPVLHWIDSEETAQIIYGEYWADYVIDIPATLFSRFEIGDAIGAFH